MSDYGDNIKYKWTPESTTLLVSVWTDKQVQKQLEYAQRPQLIWESVARYMRKKGYSVSAKQCRSRMKQVLVCYREAKRAGTRAGVEQYYESIDKVLKTKRCDANDADGVDTVDSAVPFKSPPKEVKTNKNLKMRSNKYNEPIESLTRTEALSPTWRLAHEEEYPDSPESNETVLAQPYRTFSPTRDAATNTLNARSQLLTKEGRRSLAIDEQPMRDFVRPMNSMPNNRFGEMLYQNAVQNVQNQIIQESMQQRNILEQNHPTRKEGTMGEQIIYRRDDRYFVNDDAVPSRLRQGARATDERLQNRLPQNCPMVNRAMPQEPRRGYFARNLSINCKERQPSANLFIDAIAMENRQRASNYSPETAENLNEAFCQIHKDDKSEDFNESYERQPIDNEVLRAINATTLTNNATFNDDTLSIEFIDASPSPSDNGAPGTKSLSGNSDRVPDVPARKKKVQKLEQLMLTAITSQTEVVNKILAAQDAMVSRFLDLDRDRQNRMENRLDHLMSVVHATVMKKVSAEEEKAKEEAEETRSAGEQRVITSLAPPPPPGAIPPKLDLVPPKPCRVACTRTSGVNAADPANKNAPETRPGVVSPIKQQPGAIWSKLGPVSQSPFVKAQRQLGFQVVSSSNPETRTQSSAERRIAREMESLSFDRRAIIFETEKFLEMEKSGEERTENARMIGKMGQEVAARRKLFGGRLGEPDPGIILSAAFLDAERHFSSVNNEEKSSKANKNRLDEDEEFLLLADQVENYERLRGLNGRPEVVSEPRDSSTPAKAPAAQPLPQDKHDNRPPERQTIQQLARLVAESARWRDAAAAAAVKRPSPPNYDKNPFDQGDFDYRRKSHAAETVSRRKTLGWLRDRHSYGYDEQRRANDDARDLHTRTVKSFPIGFCIDDVARDSNENPLISALDRRTEMDFHPMTMKNPTRRNVGFVDPELAPPRAIQDKGNDWAKFSSLPPLHRSMIDRYVRDRHGPVARKRDDDDNEQQHEDDDDDDEEFLDTTASMQPQTRKTSVASSSGKTANCVVS